MKQYFNVVLFVFQFSPVCNFGEFINFGLGAVSNERVIYFAGLKDYICFDHKHYYITETCMHVIRL